MSTSTEHDVQFRLTPEDTLHLADAGPLLPHDIVQHPTTGAFLRINSLWQPAADDQPNVISAATVDVAKRAARTWWNDPHAAVAGPHPAVTTTTFVAEDGTAMAAPAAAPEDGQPPEPVAPAQWAQLRQTTPTPAQPAAEHTGYEVRYVLLRRKPDRNYARLVCLRTRTPQACSR